MAVQPGTEKKGLLTSTVEVANDVFTRITAGIDAAETVSYTHLTLPTNREV